MAGFENRRQKFPSYAEFQAARKRGPHPPVYLMVGREDFLVEECVQNIIDDLLTPDTRGFNLDVVYGSKTDPKDVIAHASSFPMMSERRVVIVKEFEKLVTGETAKEIVSAYVQKPLSSTCLVLISSEPDFRKKPFTDFRKSGHVYEFRPLFDNQVPGWIAQRMTSMGKDGDLSVSRLLHAYVGSSLRAIQNELDKLFIYVGDRPRVTVDDVEAVVGVSRGFTIFDLQQAIGSKDIARATTILERMLEVGESPQMIIVILTRFFTQLWKLADLQQQRKSQEELIAELKIPPYFLRDYLSYSTNFSLRHIEENFLSLASADAELKSTSKDLHLVLDLLIYSLIRGHRDRVLEQV